MPAALAAALVLVTSAAVLVLEVLVNRLVAPYVGLTLETYTASIGVALAALAAGAALGGRLADTVDPRRWLGPATALGGALALAARPLVFAVGPSFRGTGPVGTVVLVTVAVALPVLVLATVTPGVVKLRLRTLAETGVTVGRLSALGTLGALAGTFLTGFFLLSALPTSRVLLAVGLLLVVSGLALSVALPRASAPPAGSAPGALLGVAALSVLTGGWLVVSEGPCAYETRYYCATVETDPVRAGGRTLVLDGLRHAYIDLEDPEHLEFGYTQRFGDVLAELPAGPLQALHLGGGGFTMPRWLAATRPGSRSTVLEVDPSIPEIGRAELGLDAVPDLAVRIGDGRTLIVDEPTDAYDVVVGDAFGSLAVPWHLTTTEMVEEVRRVLKPGGVYVLNVIDYPPLAFARAETATLRAAFQEVVVAADPDTLAGTGGGNLVLVAGDDALPVEGLRRRAAQRGGQGTVLDPVGAAEFAGTAQVLTDDDAPVDQLMNPYPAPA